MHQILIPRHIFGQKHKMAGAVAVFVRALVHAHSGSIDLAADDGMNPGGFGLFIKFNRTVHGTVIGNGKSCHALFFGARQQIIQTAKPV